MTDPENELRDYVANAIFNHLRAEHAETGYNDIRDCAEAFGAPVTTDRWSQDGVALDPDLVEFNGQLWTSALAQAVLDALVARGVLTLPPT